MVSLSQAIAGLKEWHKTHLYDNASKEPKGDVYEEICGVNQAALAAAIDRQGGLTSSQLHRLTAVFDSYAKTVSKPFGREFACSSSALITVDAFNHPEQGLLETIGPLALLDEFTNKPVKPGPFNTAILTHIRADNNKLALTGGGFVDQGESCKDAIEREVNEETGGGCVMKNTSLIGVWDTRRGGPEHRISVMFKGSVSGMPKENHEAKRFFFVREMDLPDLDETKVFAAHHKMMARYYQTKVEYGFDGGLDFVGRQDKIHPQKRLSIEQNYEKRKEGFVSVFVETALREVEGLYQRLTKEFQTWAQEHLDEKFERSRDSIPGWSRQKGALTHVQSQDWNDDKELWNFLEAFKMASAKVSNLFKTHVTTGECGVIEQVMLMEVAERKFVVLKDDQGFKLPSAEHRHGESFKETLYREALEQFGVRLDDDQIQLVEMQENLSRKNALGNPLRTFVFKVLTFDQPNYEETGCKVVLLTEDELLRTPLEDVNVGKALEMYSRL